MQGFPVFPDQASTFAGPVDTLYFVLVSLSLLFAGVLPFVVLYLVVHYHRSQKVDRTNPVHSNLRLELLWTIIPLFLVMGVFFWGAFLYVQIRTPPAQALEIYVIGKQWMWHAQHSNGKRENNELHIPIGRPVKLIMTSQDVIHSFYIPAFRIKQDVLPGRYTTMWFEATKPGEYHLFCAEYCGTEHSLMGGRVVALNLSEYETWLTTPGEVILPDGSNGAAAVPSTTTANADPMAAAGQQIFASLGCASCHRDDGAGVGPNLNNLFGYEQPLEDGTTVTVDENYVQESILNSTAKVAKGYQPVMPIYEGQLSNDQVNQLVAYIKSISDRGTTTTDGSAQPTAGPTGGAATPEATAAPGATVAPGATAEATAVSAVFDANLAGQGELLFTNLGCAACHRSDGAGIGPKLEGVYNTTQQLEGGGSAVADEAYIRESIQNSTAKVVQGYQPVMPVYGTQLTKDQVDQLVEYVKSLAAK